ncbi:beta-ketoacyl synthase N-terminal-like domain-containing protein [Streptomyces sp. ID05-26A]|nr:beta-ketoacyl synthase N-terminal-like domain-containing protein [Streptomyces sp. ID05-26A]
MITANRADPVPGFVESAFNPLVHDVTQRCLAERPGDGARTALLLGSVVGDSGTTDLASRLMIGGQVSNPLLFMQATANAILGYLSKEFGITGPLVAMSALTDLGSALLDTADVLLDDEELDRVLVVGVELAGSDRTTAVCRELGLEQPHEDFAVAVLIDRDSAPCEPGGLDLRGLAETKGTTP